MSGISGEVCANCGKESSDVVKLKNCAACHLVKYCSVDCQKTHRKQHKGACNERAAELKDERLYTQGRERPEGDFCPLCTLPIPMPLNKYSKIISCCTTRVCYGCTWAVEKRGMLDCAFCRTPRSEVDGAKLAKVQARVDAKDPAAINYLAELYYFGLEGLAKDLPRAIELWREAAELGSIEARYSVGTRYMLGEGVKMNAAKARQFYEVAACQGHIESRHNLGNLELTMTNELTNKKYARSVRHFMISAKMGFGPSLTMIEQLFAAGCASKEQYAEARKGYEDAQEEMKSPERDEAYKIFVRDYVGYMKAEVVRG